MKNGNGAHACVAAIVLRARAAHACCSHHMLGPCMARVLQDLQCHAGPITVVCAQNTEMCAWCGLLV